MHFGGGDRFEDMNLGASYRSYASMTTGNIYVRPYSLHTQVNMLLWDSISLLSSLRYGFTVMAQLPDETPVNEPPGDREYQNLGEGP